MKLVIIDDELLFIEGLKSYIETFFPFIEVKCFLNVNYSIEYFKKNKTDILLIDYNLSGRINGIEVVKIIKKISPVTEIILMTCSSPVIEELDLHIKKNLIRKTMIKNDPEFGNILGNEIKCIINEKEN